MTRSKMSNTTTTLLLQPHQKDRQRAEAAEAAVEAKKRLKNLLYLLLSKLKSRGWRRKHRHLATKIYTK